MFALTHFLERDGVLYNHNKFRVGSLGCMDLWCLGYACLSRGLFLSSAAELGFLLQACFILGTCGLDRLDATRHTILAKHLRRNPTALQWSMTSYIGQMIFALQDQSCANSSKGN